MHINAQSWRCMETLQLQHIKHYSSAHQLLRDRGILSVWSPLLSHSGLLLSEPGPLSPVKAFLWNRAGLDIWQTGHPPSGPTCFLSRHDCLLTPPNIWLCHETGRSSPRLFSQLTQLARSRLSLRQPRLFPSVLHISSKVVKCTSIILFVLWDAGRNVIGCDVAALPWWWDDNEADR